MLPRLATLAAALAALAAVAKGAPPVTSTPGAVVEAAATTEAEVAATTEAEEEALPNCSLFSDKNATAIEVFCLMNNRQYRLRISHQPVAAPPEHSRLVVVCEPHRVQLRDFEALYAMNLQLGKTYSVLLHQCPLPTRLRDFLERLGVHGVRLVKVRSLSMLNDTMQADFLEGLDLETLLLYDLTRIELHDNFLASTVNLHNLTISGTKTNLPDGLLHHTPQLHRLALRNLDFGHLPTTFLHGLHNLTKLLISRNSIRELTHEHLRDLGQLRLLDLYKNQLETLPEDVFASLAALEELRIECNPLQAMHEALFAGTSRLAILRINGLQNVHVDVPSLPAGIFRGLSQLERLDLERLGLQRLPSGLFLGLTGLRNLTLRYNQLTELPDSSFSELPALRFLDLGSNQLRKLSPGLLWGLRSLDTLYLNRNNLTELPNEMFARTSNLQRLFLQDNNLTTLEELAFSGLDCSLHHLDLSNNNLHLGSREPAFAAIREVRNMNLRKNRIRMIPDQIRYNLIKLKRLDLEHNELQTLDMAATNLLANGAEISVMYNNISRIHVKWQPSGKAEPNKIYVGNNPLVCDCYAYSLNDFLNRTKGLRSPNKPHPDFFLVADELRCAEPEPLASRSFSDVTADELVCPKPDGCPAGCSCTIQPSRRALVTSCSRLPSRTPNVTLSGYTVSLQINNATLRSLGDMTWLTGPVASLQLSNNFISNLTIAVLPAGLKELRLDHNRVARVGAPFLERLDATSNSATRVWLGNNPFVCDCALLPLHHYLQLHLSNKTLRIMDAGQMTCVGGDGSSLLEMTSEQLCPSHTTTIVVVCVVAIAVAVCLLVVLCVYYRHAEMLKVWLYSHNLCLWFVTEEELDADKKYDAFISYSHLDEQFVVEQLVPELERGEPKYDLCLHFRDWLAGEWITDQIQRSVQDSRRVIVVMSPNFIQSEWGRLEFLAAHKQAMEDRRSRVIVIVYGELPNPADMDPELRLYISMNTYLEWGDAHFWQRLRYALPHKGRRLKRRHGRPAEKLGMVGLTNGTGPTLPSGNGVINNGFIPTPLPIKHDNGEAHQMASQVV